ncbi:hypothetical protein ANTRET_LOCUS8616 [Anthophora retusa]
MDGSTLDRRFLRINKKLGILTGVWPSDEYSTKWISRIVLIFIIIPTYITQFSRLIVFPRMDIFLNDYPHLLVGLGISIKVGNYFINEAELKSLIGKIYEDWRNTISEDEYNIMSKYAKRGVLVVALYILHVVVCILLFICIPYVPPILDIIMPLNETREPLLVYPAYYFIDQIKYHYWIVAHMTVVLSYLGCTFCACDANYVYAVQHACGLLAVTGYRFKYACFEVTDNDQNTAEMTRKMYKNVCHSILLHQRAIEWVFNFVYIGKRYVKVITTTHDTCMFITVSLLMMSISASLLRMSGHDRDPEWVKNSAFLVAQLFHMLFLVIQGQFVLDSYDNLYNTIYESTWYNSSPETQALYVLTLRSSLNPPLLTAGGFITLNLKTFAEIIKTSVSYYTVMQST